MRGVAVVVVAIVVRIGVNGAAAAQDAPAPSAAAKPPAADTVAAKPVAARGAARGSEGSPAPPQQLPSPQEGHAAPPETSSPAAAPPEPSACQTRLAKIATFQPIPVLVGAGGCGAVDAVLLESITLPDQTKVPLMPAATLRCPMAEAIAHWVREDVAPAVAKIGPPLRGLDNFDSYECRGRNRVPGALLSEHGRANALDVRGFRLADGRTIELTDVNVDKAWREGIRASVCARFSTVLGPGSDGYHEQHIHLDLAERRNNYKICEWDVREPPAAAAKQAPAHQQTPSAETEEPPAEASAAIPEGTVPLPRPRPALVNGPARRMRHSRFDRPLAIAPQ